MSAALCTLYSCASRDQATVQCSLLYLAVLTPPLLLSFGIVGFYHHEGREHAYSSSTEGSHNGIHMGQLTGQVHHPDELRVGCACRNACSVASDRKAKAAQT